jgi:hypothetical protein
MKTFKLSALFILCLLATAFTSNAQQVEKTNVNEQFIVIGNGSEKLPAATMDALLKGYIEKSVNQIIFVAGQSFVSTYYAIYDKEGKLVQHGNFRARHAGQYSRIDLGQVPKNYTIRFSPVPILASI